MSTIPASEIVQVNPSVLSAGGAALDVIGLLLSTAARVPIGTVQSFPDAASVSDYFGASSDEASAAATYFNGFDNASKRPASVLFAQYNEDAVAAFLRSGALGLTLAELQALTGSLNVVMDGVAFNAPSVVLSPATSPSDAASIIETALDAAAPAAASVTGSIGGVVTASAGAAFAGTGSGTNLTAATVVGVLHPGAALSGTGIPAGTYIVSQTSGTPGSDGVYVTNHVTTSSGDAITAISNTLDVTGVTSGTLQPGDAISGSGMAVGTTILAQLTGGAGSTGTYAISSQQNVASTTVTSLSTVLNVTAVGSGALEVGAVVSGTNVTLGSTITALGTGTGGTGTYDLSDASTTVSETIAAAAAAPTVAYDSVTDAFVISSGLTGALSTAAFATGTLSASLKLTSATGAVLSQGAAAAAPGTFMDGVVAVTTDWVTFATLFDPDVSGSTNKQAFAAWNTLQDDRYVYVCWDTDQSPTAADPATSSLGYILENDGNSGACLLDGDANAGWDAAAGAELAAFVCGAAASIDFEQTNGRITFAFKSESGIIGTVTSAAVAINLGGSPMAASRGNGYNFYGAYGAANGDFVWLQRGFVTGAFKWLDSYINQVVMTTTFQGALLTLFQNALSIPYSTAGNQLIEAALADPIAAFLRFGAFAPGSISNAQAAEVNAQAGARISDTLQSQGWFLQILPASSTSRAARTTPPCKFWYLDRGSIQSIVLSSIAVQ